MAKNAVSLPSVGVRAQRSSNRSVPATKIACNAYTSAMTAWLQNVYDVTNTSEATRPPATDAESSVPASTITPAAIAPSTADARLSAYAGSPCDTRANSPPMAKYSG
jgi:hypothetical protein